MRYESEQIFHVKLNIELDCEKMYLCVPAEQSAGEELDRNKMEPFDTG